MEFATFLIKASYFIAAFLFIVGLGEYAVALALVVMFSVVILGVTARDIRGTRLARLLFEWKVPASEESALKSADVILGQSFGLRSDGPGLSNYALAFVVARLAKRYSLPAVLQWEIADCLPNVHIAGVIRRHRSEGKYLDTYEVLAQSAELCRARGWKRAIVVAHPDHMWRCVQTAKKLGLMALVPPMPEVPYDPASSQSWTRSRARFLPREIIARLLFLLKGWI